MSIGWTPLVDCTVQALSSQWSAVIPGIDRTSPIVPSSLSDGLGVFEAVRPAQERRRKMIQFKGQVLVGDGMVAEILFKSEFVWPKGESISR